MILLVGIHTTCVSDLAPSPLALSALRKENLDCLVEPWETPDPPETLCLLLL